MLQIDRSSAVWDTVWARDVYADPETRTLRARQKISTIQQFGFALLPDQRLLEIGCGSGHVLHEIASRFPRAVQLMGCDISSVGLNQAANRLSQVKTQPVLMLAGAEALPLPARSVDVIIAFGVVEHSRRPDLALGEMQRVLKPGGRVYFSTSSTRSLVYLARRFRELLKLWPYGYQKNYSPAEFCGLVSSYFRVCSLEVSQTGFDFPILATVDRLFAGVIPRWGRYVILSAENGTRNG